MEPEGSKTLQLCATIGWRVGDAVIVGLVAYAATLLFLMLGMYVVYSVPSFHSRLWVYALEQGVYVLVGLLGGIVFGGPLVMWFMRRRKISSLAQSIEWQCSNRTLGWVLLFGLVFGIVLSFVRAGLAARGYRHQPVEFIIAFVILTGLAAPVLEEIYFRGILFVALARRFGDIASIAAVTLLFCIAHPRQQWLTVLPVAILLGGVRLYTRSVKACFVCHAAYNVSLALLMLPMGGLIQVHGG